MKSVLLRIVSAFLLLLPVMKGAGAWTVRKLGPTLVDRSGGRYDTDRVLRGKMVCVYFSASWCGPCRMFTPKLVKFYKAAARANGLEVVLVCRDRTEKAMFNYMKNDLMPWYAVPFGAPEGTALMRELGIGGIPTLAVFAPDGRLITQSGRADVVRQGKGAAGLWKRQAGKTAPRGRTGAGKRASAASSAASSSASSAAAPSSSSKRSPGNTGWLSEKFGSELLNSSGGSTEAGRALGGKMVCVYFASPEDDSCRRFTRSLLQLYRGSRGGRPFEVVLVTSGRGEGGTRRHRAAGSMPWYGLPGGSAEAERLRKELNVSELPVLAVFAPDGRLVVRDARRDVLFLGGKAVERWSAPVYKPLTYDELSGR